MGALRLSAGGGFGAGALACSWGWLGQFAVEEGTFGSTVTVGRRARSRGWALVGGVWWERERCISDACAMVLSENNGYVRVLYMYQGDWRTCGTVVCLVGRVMLLS